MNVRAASIGRTAGAGDVVDRVRAVLTPLNLHLAGVVVLVVVNAYLLAQLGFAWSVEHSQNADALAAQRIQLRAAQIAAMPLQGLDGKLTRSTEEADKFYATRLPYAYSQISAELGALSKKENVKLTRVQYAPAPVLEDPSVTELHIDTSLSGDYRPLVELINNIERDKTFFLISGVALTGQQNGNVNLRLRLITYLRAPKGNEKSDTLPTNTGDDAGGDKPATGGPAR